MVTTTDEPMRSSVAQYIRSLSNEDKDAALVELVQEAIRETGGRQLLPIRSASGAPLGYFVPPDAAQQHLRTVLPALTDEDRARSQRALADLSKTFDIEDFFTEPAQEGRD